MAVHWSLEEENLLANMFIEVSEDANHTTPTSFQDEVTRKFNDESDGVHRTKHSITGKWRRMSCECTKFDDIYSAVQRTGLAGDQLAMAMTVFKERTHGRNFQYMQPWFILRNTPIGTGETTNRWKNCRV